MTDTRFSGPILCPVDLADQSIPVLHLAASVANACSLRLVLVHAVESDVPPYFTPARTGRIEAELELTRNTAGRELARLVREAGITPAPEIRIEDGDAPGVIRRLSQSLGVTMIAMGTHGRSGLARIEHGSVAEEVLHVADVPVLTAGPGRAIAGSPPILCPVTDSQVSRVSLSWAIAMARCFGTRLTVLHVIEPGNPRPILDLCAWVERDLRPECQIQEMTRHGNAADEILRLASDLGAGLLVIGATHKLVSEKTVIGTTAAKLVRRSPCPVLTIPGGKHVIPG